MDTTERMMIMGMCLQGLLTNPSWSKTKHLVRRLEPNPAYAAGEIGAPEEIVVETYEPMTEADLKAQRTELIREAHRLADALDPPPAMTAAHEIMFLTRSAYEVLRAADADGAGSWPTFDEARASHVTKHVDDLDGVFERVSRWFHDPTGFPETVQDRIIAAIVAASKGGL